MHGTWMHDASRKKAKKALIHC